MAYSPTTDRWRVVDTPDFVPRRSVSLAWTGTTVLAVGLIGICAAANVGPCGNLKPALAAFDPHTSRWSALNADALGPPGNPDYVYGSFVARSGPGTPSSLSTGLNRSSSTSLT
jgi:hypothetical protein